jgi:hypothetical protein
MSMGGCLSMGGVDRGETIAQAAIVSLTGHRSAGTPIASTAAVAGLGTNA